MSKYDIENVKMELGTYTSELMLWEGRNNKIAKHKDQHKASNSIMLYSSYSLANKTFKYEDQDQTVTKRNFT
uniref:Putative ovule protein n=1 Tax=Solanum chacoense TaxID=4108 RepID=A0A0V0GZP6_SOLCH